MAAARPPGGNASFALRPLVGPSDSLRDPTGPPVCVPNGGQALVLRRDLIASTWLSRESEKEEGQCGESSAMGVSNGDCGEGCVRLASGVPVAEAADGAKRLFVKCGKAAFRQLRSCEQLPLSEGDVVGVARRAWKVDKQGQLRWAPEGLFRFELVNVESPAAALAITSNSIAATPPALAAHGHEELTMAYASDSPYRHFDGRDVCLNSLILQEGVAALTASRAVGCSPDEVARADLIWRPAALQTALFTSYGTDYFFLSELVRGSPAAARPRGVTVVDNYDHHRTPSGLDEATYTPSNEAVGCHFSVVLPPFFDDGAAAADRTRVHHGTMHPKLWLLAFDAGGLCGRGFLRLVISSANLGRYDARINNQFWVCDFVRSDDAGAAVQQLSESELKAELEERGVNCDALYEEGAREMSEWRAELVEARRRDSAEFGSDLRLFVRRLLQPAAPELHELWADLLDQYELAPPPGTHLILTAPGRYSLTKETERAGVKDAELYGQAALRRHLRADLHGRAMKAGRRPTLVEFACSSLGDLRGPYSILQTLMNVLPNGEQRTGERLDRGAFLTEAEYGAKAKLLWPTLAVSLPAFARGQGLLTIGGGKHTMTGPSDLKCRQLKHCMAHNITSAPARSATLHHVKMAAGIIAGGARATGEPPLCAWLYAGSHNLSGAAWGKLEARNDEDDDEEEEEEFVCMSYELGVLLVPPTPRRFKLPWMSIAEEYDPTEMRPFSTNRYLAVLRGFDVGSSAWGGGGDIRGARIDSTEAAEKEWRRSLLEGGVARDFSAGPSLPPLLSFQLSQRRKLVKLVVAAADSVLVYDTMPMPQSEMRRQRRHLKRNDEEPRKDELRNLHSARMPLPIGTVLRAVRLTDYSYGKGEEKEAGDPIVAVYETIGDIGHGSTRTLSSASRHSFVVDFDRSLKVIDRNGPPGVLLALMRDGGDNSSLLHTLALAASEVETACWGALLLCPDELAGRVGPVEDGRMPPATPSHADLIALEFGVQPATDLPALILVTFDLSHAPALWKGERELWELARADAEPLKRELVKLAETPRDELSLKGQETSVWKRHQEMRLSRAAQAAKWVRETKGVRLLLVEPEGVMKKQCNKSVVTTAAKALSMRRASRFGASRFDSFLAACVPFFRALLLRHATSEDDDVPDKYDPFTEYGDGPPPGTLRPDAPSIALVTNMGHLVSKLRPGESILYSEDEVREVVHKLTKRLESELGLEASVLATKLTVHISFLAPGASAPQIAVSESTPPADLKLLEVAPIDSEPVAVTEAVATVMPEAGSSGQSTTVLSAACSPEWSAEWAKPQPGMLLEAMAAHAVEPSETLMLGYDMVDEEAASRAGVPYIEQQYLLGVEMFDAGFDEDRVDEWYLPASREFKKPTAKAPGSFAAHSRSKEGKRTGVPLPRSPAKVAAK